MDNLTNPSDQSRHADDDGSAPGNRQHLAGPGKRRRAVVLAAGVVVCGLATVPLVAALSGTSHPALVRTVTGGSPTTGSPQASTVPPTTSTSVPGAVAPEPTTSEPATTAVSAAKAAPTTAAVLACTNSFDPACGAFRWDPAPAPADQASVSIIVSPPEPIAGQRVTFTVHIVDPDTTVTTCGQVDYGAGMGQGCSAASPGCQTRYGPWSPPAKNPSSTTATYDYTYTTAGSYTFYVRYPTGSACYDPYQNQVAGAVRVVVGGGGTTTTTS